MSLRGRMMAGLTWTGGVRWLGVAVSTGTTAVLARLLVPADFAVVVAAGALAAVVGVVQESGLAAAVVQHPRDDDRVATTALVLNLVAASLGVVCCVAVAPWLARLFGIEQPAALAAAFAPLWLRAWTNVPRARLEKRLAFGRSALVEGVQVLAYPAVTIPVAWAGFGAWALVLGQAGAAAAGAVAVWVLSSWRPRLRDFDWPTGRELVRYGRPLVGSNLLAIVNDRVDSWAVGSAFGPAALGLYAMAFRLAALPRTAFSFVVSRVLFPTMALLQEDRRRFRVAYLRGLHWVAALAMPACVGLAVMAPELVGVVLGARWTDSVPSVRILAGFGLLASLSATTGDVFKASGRSSLILRIGIVHSAALWSGLALLGRYGIAYVALAVTLATAVSCITAFACVLSIVEVGPRELWGAVRAPAVASAVMAVSLVAFPLDGHVTALAVGVVVGAAVYLGVLALLAPEDVHELGAALDAVRAPSPAIASGVSRR